MFRTNRKKKSPLLSRLSGTQASSQAPQGDNPVLTTFSMCTDIKQSFTKYNFLKFFILEALFIENLKHSETFRTTLSSARSAHLQAGHAAEWRVTRYLSRTCESLGSIPCTIRTETRARKTDRDRHVQQEKEKCSFGLGIMVHRSPG